MKYGLTPTKIVPKKNANFAAAVEALTDSLDKMSSAYEAVVAAEGRVTEVETVISNATMAVESIKQYGITAQNMALLNGKDHDLDRALGMEDLDVTAIETLSAATKDLLKSQYVAGLEGKAAEFFKALVERVKAFFAKLVGWLKELFTFTSSLKKLVADLKFDGEFDAEKKVSCLKMDDFQKAFGYVASLQSGIVTVTKDANGTTTTSVKPMLPKDVETVLQAELKLDKSYGTAKELGWTTASAASAKTQFDKLDPKAFANAWNQIQAQYRSDISKNADDPASKDTLLAHFDDWRMASKITGKFNALYRKIGFTLIALSKLVKAPAGQTPAAPAQLPASGAK